MIEKINRNRNRNRNALTIIASANINKGCISAMETLNEAAKAEWKQRAALECRW